jgi:hypothetical protein
VVLLRSSQTQHYLKNHNGRPQAAFLNADSGEVFIHHFWGHHPGFSDFVPGLPSETPNLTKIASGLLERTSYWRYIAVSQAGVGHPDAGRLLSDGLVDK